MLFPAFAQLRGELKFKFHSLRKFDECHWTAMVRLWVRQGIAPSTINTRLSVLRILCGWIGKPGLIPEVTDLERFGFGPATARRVSHATEDRAGSDEDMEVRFQAAEAIDLRYALILRLERLYGTRRKESVRFRPHRGDLGDAIHIAAGAKGGQQRRVPIRTREQRALLDRCKAVIPPGDSMSGADLRDLKRALRRASWLATKVGLTKKDSGNTQHGQRQGYINGRIEEETGAVASVRDPSSRLPSDPEAMDKRRMVMREVGHRRPDAVRAYYGRARPATTHTGATK